MDIFISALICMIESARSWFLRRLYGNTFFLYVSRLITFVFIEC